METKQQMKIKYNRVSTIKQSGDRFEVDQEKYDLVLFERISGFVPFRERPKAQELVNLAESGVVSELHLEEMSRIGRNTGDCISTLEWLDSHKVNVVIRNLGLQS